jgi:serine/threonine protein phosphatase PrpC
MSFDIEAAVVSERGRCPGNEDFAAVASSPAGDPDGGWIAVIADGVSAGGGGAEAAQSSVISLVQDFFAAPATWDTSVTLDRLINAQNEWLADHNRRRQSAGRHARIGTTTLTALVLRGHGYAVAHVGDTRAWLIRGGECALLTQDHCFEQPDLTHALTRALGLEPRVRVDYLEGELHLDDVYLLTTDGLHGTLKSDRIHELVRGRSAQDASQALVRAALEAGSRDNVTAVVARVRGLAAGRFGDALRASRLPVPRLRAGDRIDGYEIISELTDNGVHRLYRARCVDTGRWVAIKTLHESRAADPEEREMLAHEAWLGLRLGERADPKQPGGFVRVHEPLDPSAFYVVFDWHDGRSLEEWLASGRSFSVLETIEAAAQVARALGRMHRAGVVHRDIKPANLHLGEDRQWRIMDLGVALSGREPKAQRTLRAGTPSFMNPEQWDEPPQPPDAASDLYALGVTLYRWLTGRLPYGQVEPYARARFRRDPIAPSRWRPDVPLWLDYVVLKLIARDPKARFETAEELALALERGAARPLPAPGATPLALRDPLTLWQIALAVSLLFNALLILWLLFLPR